MAGQQNDGVGTSGGNGGGIILIEALQLTTTGPCGGLSISANGNSVGNAGNDGSGGGGGGGSIVLNVGTYSIAAGCTLTISSNAGNGGNVTDPATHSGGGGGGQGTVIFAGPQPVTNITTTANNGTGGFNNSGHSSAASNGGGSNGSGILSNMSNPLPIELVLFTGHTEGTINKLIWITMSEVNNDYFTLEKSADGINFTPFDKINGAGNSTIELDYSAYDYQPFSGISYYRLKQTDYNGAFSYSNIVALDNGLNTISVENMYPNPTNDFINFDFNTPVKGNIHTQVIAYTGQVVTDNIQSVSEGKSILKTDMSNFAKGIYSLRISFDLIGYSYTSLVVKE